MILPKTGCAARLASALLLLVCLVPPPGALAQAETTAAEAERLSREFESLMLLVPEDQALGMALTKAAETWHRAALNWARRFSRQEAEAFLKQAQASHTERVTRNQSPLSRQISALNLLYLSTDALANLLSGRQADTEVLSLIRSTEERVYAITKRTGDSEPALAAISGGVMTMLAVIAGQATREESLRERLTAEFERRRKIDENISGMKDAAPGERLLLLTHNHLHGSLSMVQIIGLALAPDLKPGLAAIEQHLIKTMDDDETVQLIEGAKALARSGFLVAPLIDRISGEESSRQDSGKR